MSTTISRPKNGDRIGKAAVFLALAAMALAVTLFLRNCSQAHTRPSGQMDVAINSAHGTQKLVFSGSGQGGRDLYILDLRKRNVQRLTDTPAYEKTPAFSPDDASIVFTAGVTGDAADHIWIMLADGKNSRQITADPYNDTWPSFSPNGLQIVFARDVEHKWGGLASTWGYDQDLYLINRDGSGLKRLTSEHYLNISHPRFSNDGKKIIFTAMSKADLKKQTEQSPNSSGNIYQLELTEDSSSPQALTGDSTTDYSSLAPDSKSIVSSSYSGLLRLADASGATNRSSGNAIVGRQPVFSADGKRVFFLQEEASSPQDSGRVETRYGLWAMRLDGQKAQQIAGSKLFENPMNWKRH